MTSVADIRPTIVKGRWSGPPVLPSWHQCVRDPNSAGGPLVGGQLPEQIDISQYPYLQYWNNVQQEYERLVASGQQRDEMDTEANEDSMGVPLPEPTKDGNASKGKKANVRVVFDQQCAQIEKGFAPLGLVSPDGKSFKFIMPPGHMGEQISKRVLNIPFMVRQAASQRYRRSYEVYLIISKVMPVPLHTSPLALLMVREPERCMRYKDAISTLHGLHILRHAMHEMDTENMTHKTRCWSFYATLEAYVSERFYAELDRLSQEERDGGGTREVAQVVARKFGDAVTRYALDMVHAIEWCCMDILKLPYELRHLFMTPPEIPRGEDLTDIAFRQMRIQTIRYVTDRNKIYCGLYADEEDPETKQKKRVFKGIDPKAWCAMQLEHPPLADRPTLLGEWKQDTDPQLAAACLFGIYNGWIDIHTLREYMRMLEVDSRPETAAKMAALYARSEEGLNTDEAKLGLEQGNKMDTTEDAAPVAESTMEMGGEQ
jgi:hypothetical protein